MTISSDEQVDQREIPIQKLEGVGVKTAAALKKMNIEIVDDLLHHFPHRYIDLRSVKKISDVRGGDEVTIRGVVKEVRKTRGRRGTNILNVGIFDGTGYIYGVWFNQDFIADRLPEGAEAAFSGKSIWSYGKLQIQNPLFDLIGDSDRDAINTGRVIPIHPATKTLSAGMLRRLIRRALDDFDRIEDPLPATLIQKYNLPSKRDALFHIHFPAGRREWISARKRLVFEELLIVELGLILRKRRQEALAQGVAHKVNGGLLDRYFKTLPWPLTADQRRVIDEIEADVTSLTPMHRLLQGEVGSGKTFVALAAMLMAVGDNYQAAMMAPTEILASQHYFNLRPFLDKLGIKSILLLGSMKAAERHPGIEALADGSGKIAFGTHALIQEAVNFQRLGLAVIDEQHRFGVRQRLSLRGKGIDPDILVMTATPIPRTIALTLYGDLDVSTLKELPAGRNIGEQVKTVFFPEPRRAEAYRLIGDEIAAGYQAYVVCPLIDESDQLQLKSVIKEAEYLKSRVFSDRRVGFIHGKLDGVDKDKVMGEFRDGRLDILIATSVIEVGVDVPNATVILIEHAERFGLSQLHQLRGRVGRGRRRGKCLLFADITTDEARERLEAIVKIKDGFTLAETDLRIRGEGQLFGIRQSGMPDLRIAKLTKHEKVLIQAREEAMALLDDDPQLAAPAHEMLLIELKKKFAGSGEWLFSG